MAWLAFGRLTYELAEGETIVGSGADATWLVDKADLLPKHFVVSLEGRRATIHPATEEAVIAVDGSQVVNSVPLVDGATISAGGGRFLFSQDSPRVVAAEPSNGVKAYLLEELAGIAHPLNHRSTPIGRDASNEIVVRNPTASRFHADIRREAGGYAIHSMGSAGTVLNGKLMKQPVLLSEGDTIEIAFTIFEFTRNEPPTGMTVAVSAANENDETSRKPTLATEWVVDEEGEPGDRVSPIPAILGLLWFLVFATLAWLRWRHR